MKISFQKIKLFLALICICLMAQILGIPVIPQEKLAKILQTNDRNIAADVIQAGDEQL
jgi:energy-converting hydrogenase Eha subunit A